MMRSFLSRRAIAVNPPKAFASPEVDPASIHSKRVVSGGDIATRIEPFRMASCPHMLN
jgi:hypothetical protein